MSNGQPSIGKYGDIGYEVVADGRSIAIFKAECLTGTDRETGRSFSRKPTSDAMQRAFANAVLFKNTLLLLDGAEASRTMLQVASITDDTAKAQNLIWAAKERLDWCLNAYHAPTH